LTKKIAFNKCYKNIYPIPTLAQKIWRWRHGPLHPPSPKDTLVPKKVGRRRITAGGEREDFLDQYKGIRRT